MTAPADEIYDVLVVGMGPVGATAANIAGHLGLRTAVVEPLLEVFPLPRATHFDAEIMRIFQDVGLAEPLRPVLATYDGGVHLGADGQPIRDFRVTAEPGPLGWYPHYTFLQPEIEQVLRDQARPRPGVDVHLGWEAVDLREGDDLVSVEIRSGDGTRREVRARYVIACDGASSPVRKVLGIELLDYGFEEPWIIIDAVVPSDAALPTYSVMWCDPERPATYVPQPGRHRRWEFMLLEGESADDMSQRSAVDGLLRRSIDPADVEIVRSAVYRFHGLVAESWRRGRVFLAGDAAHQTPPFYGQGMCHGIRDVSNLLWKLRLVREHPGLAGLLDTYETERIPHVRTIIDAAVENGRYICILDPDLARERDERLRARMAAGADVSSFRSVIPGLTSGLVLTPQDDHDEAGQLMIQPEVTSADAAPALLDDCVPSGFLLLCRQPPPPADAARFADQLGGSVVVLDDDGEARAGEGGRLFADDGGVLRGWLHEHSADAVLVRPDHYIFATAAGPDAARDLLASLSESLTHLTMTTTPAIGAIS